MTLVDTSVWVEILRDRTETIARVFRQCLQGEIYALSDQRQLEFPGLKCLHILPIM